MTIREYAVSRSISYEAVAKQIRQYKKKELKKHITYQGRTAELDDFAVEFLDQHRQPRSVVMQASTEETQRELERLHNQVHQLQAELQKKSDKIEKLLEDQNTLIADKARNDALLLIADKEHDELQELRTELSKYQRTLFGLYRKI
jgi:signal transduction protein with GAF and PtsI domain